MSDEDATEAVERVRPLTATQTSNLLKLVKNDFESLSMELQTQAYRDLRAEQERIRDEVNTEAINSFKDKVDELTKAYSNSVRDLIDEAKDLGISLTGPSVQGAAKANDMEMQKKLIDVQQKSDKDLNLVKHLIDREQNKVARRVLVASVTTDAEDVLNSLPSAAQMMEKAVALDEPMMIQWRGSWMSPAQAALLGWKGHSS